MVVLSSLIEFSKISKYLVQVGTLAFHPVLIFKNCAFVNYVMDHF